MVLTLRDLFRHRDRQKARARREIKVTVSFLEVYNENIRDLLGSCEDPRTSAARKEAAKNIKTDVKRNVLEVNHHISAREFDDGAGGAAEDLPLDALLDAPRASAPARVAKTPGADKAALKEMKAWMQENFRERMQLRRTLIELEDQNVQNSIEIGKRQIIVADWNASRVQTPKAGPSGDRVAVLLADAPEHVHDAYGECEQLRKAIEKNGRTKGETKKRLRENEKGAERFHAELRNDRRVTSDERRELLELAYRIGNLELGNMQLEQAQVIHSSVVKGKDLTIQKLQLQLLMRDKVIAQQRDILKANDLDSDVGHVGLQLMEQRAMSQNFDTLRSTTPAPHRLGDPDPCNAHKKSHRFTEHSGDALNEATDALEHAKHRRSHSPIDTPNFQATATGPRRDRDDREVHHRRHRRHAPDDDDASSHQRVDRHDRRRHAPKDRDRDRLSSLGIAGHSALHRGGFHDADASSNSQAERGDDEAGDDESLTARAYGAPRNRRKRNPNGPKGNRRRRATRAAARAAPDGFGGHRDGGPYASNLPSVAGRAAYDAESYRRRSRHARAKQARGGANPRALPDGGAGLKRVHPLGGIGEACPPEARSSTGPTRPGHHSRTITPEKAAPLEAEAPPAASIHDEALGGLDLEIHGVHQSRRRASTKGFGNLRGSRSARRVQPSAEDSAALQSWKTKEAPGDVDEGDTIGLPFGLLGGLGLAVGLVAFSFVPVGEQTVGIPDDPTKVPVTGVKVLD
ncbi:hypothetical protein JL722_15118 [Aureococcus anophagefferens]|nr:hypothetical protein JL722_15118 [Aureococcus anophagefferens]